MIYSILNALQLAAPWLGWTTIVLLATVIVGFLTIVVFTLGQIGYEQGVQWWHACRLEGAERARLEADRMNLHDILRYLRKVEAEACGDPTRLEAAALDVLDGNAGRLAELPNVDATTVYLGPDYLETAERIRAMG